ncbi:hypothetical protein A4X09_0g4488 [Tilletia walkeri]|uniref:Uncharacterized protein n=1 Tax=Tilletia walkeri TaxID=117179 RepID=A0A8X7N8Q4_9BASI|nr:hypothetical protein A4X09_0g4488 [Tilletia walkeri]
MSSNELQHFPLASHRSLPVKPAWSQPTVSAKPASTRSAPPLPCTENATWTRTVSKERVNPENVSSSAKEVSATTPPSAHRISASLDSAMRWEGAVDNSALIRWNAPALAV